MKILSILKSWLEKKNLKKKLPKFDGYWAEPKIKQGILKVSIKGEKNSEDYKNCKSLKMKEFSWQKNH